MYTACLPLMMACGICCTSSAVNSISHVRFAERYINVIVDPERAGGGIGAGDGTQSERINTAHIIG